MEPLERRYLLTTITLLPGEDSYSTPFETQLTVPAATGVLSNDQLIYQESFELPPNQTYALEGPFDDLSLSFFDQFAVPDNDNTARAGFQEGFDGSFAIMGQNFDFDGGDPSRIISVIGMAISGATDLEATIALAAGSGFFEGSDGIKIFQAIDGAFPSTLIGQFSPHAGRLKLDTDFDGTGDGAELDNVLRDFTFPISGTGIVLDITIEVTSDDVGETIVVDNLRTSATGVGTATNALSPTEHDGTVTLDDDGSFTYVPPVGFVGEDTFTYDYEASSDFEPATVTIMVEPPGDSFDFGDAPTAAQSGLPADYPVTLGDDGARHRTGSLRLGTSIDGESDGLPDVSARGDDDANTDDEDGVTTIAPIVMLSDRDLTSSVQVVASTLGRLDAWIDFNRNGSWNDAGEQIAIDIELTPGDNIVSFPVPKGSDTGATAARFRLSSAGGLSPTGNATDGEVEDYIVTIIDGAIPIDVDVDLPETETLVRVDSDEYVVTSGSVEIFRAPIRSVASINIGGTPNADELMLDLDGLTIPPDGLDLNGGEGDNTLSLSGSDSQLDLTDPLVTADNFATIDLSSGDATGIRLDAEAIRALSPTTGAVSIEAAELDEIQVRDANQWRMTDPLVVDGQFVLTADNSVSSGQESIAASVSRPWQNFLQLGDVNNDGDVSALDALLIIIELGNRTVSDRDSKDLDDPLGIAQWPGLYFDHTGDGKATSLDALRVINDLAIVSVSSQDPEAEDVLTLGETPLVVAPLVRRNLLAEVLDDLLDSFIGKELVVEEARVAYVWFDNPVNDQEHIQPDTQHDSRGTVNEIDDLISEIEFGIRARKSS